jgi:hypothetical protein
LQESYIKILMEHRVSHLVCATDPTYKTDELVKSGEIPTASDADPGCLFRIRDVYSGSGMFIPDPDFYPSRIVDPGSNNNNNERGRGKNLFFYLFCNPYNRSVQKKIESIDKEI